jgi:hypothetical protein
MGTASQRKPKGPGVGGGLGEPSGRPNSATLQSLRRHIPLYVGICVQPYCGQDRCVPETAKKTKAPHKRGSNRDLLDDPVPIENLKQRECGAFPPSRGARPALRFPRSPPADSHCRQATRRKGGTTGLIHMKARLRGLLALVAALAAAEAVVAVAWA